MSVSLINGHIDDDVQMTDNEIINALECCCSPKVNACDDCPFHKRCYENNEWLEKEAIDLINRQKAEIERLEQEKGQFEADVEMFTDIGKMYSELKAEAVKEFAERLKGTALDTYFSYASLIYELREEDIDNLVKEMVGEG